MMWDKQVIYFLSRILSCKKSFSHSPMLEFFVWEGPFSEHLASLLNELTPVEWKLVANIGNKTSQSNLFIRFQSWEYVKVMIQMMIGTLWHLLLIQYFRPFLFSILYKENIFLSLSLGSTYVVNKILWIGIDFRIIKQYCRYY